MKKNNLEDWLALELEEKTFDEVLEDFDLSPYEVFWLLFQQGLIDEDLIEMKVDDYN